jgi:hypothetical protein
MRMFTEEELVNIFIGLTHYIEKRKNKLTEYKNELKLIEKSNEFSYAEYINNVNKSIEDINKKICELDSLKNKVRSLI